MSTETEERHVLEAVTAGRIGAPADVGFEFPALCVMVRRLVWTNVMTQSRDASP